MSLHEFNLALLGKQLWNLIQKPSSLVARVFKAKYYPNRDVLDTGEGYNPSYVWRSVLASKDILREGLRWRVENGHKIDIWQDRWIPSSLSYKIESSVSQFTPTTSVYELLDLDSRTWNYSTSILSTDKGF
ncbi:unnamed protein product [Linum trigynum]|uniref:Mitochondrial protein n=1 Tax=Linum trigynum TaxID=586398 RepID=A0AAV2CPJ3_9ROSI